MFGRWRERFFSTKKFSNPQAEKGAFSVQKNLQETGFPQYEKIANGLTKHSDFFKDFCWYCQLIVDHGEKEARRLMRQNLELQLTAVGHEMKGHHAQAVMLVKQDKQGKIIFTREDARGGEDLEGWYLSGGVKNLVTNSSEQTYFAAEDRQVGEILSSLRQWLAAADSPTHGSISWKKNNLKLTAQLTTLLPTLRSNLTEPAYLSPSFLSFSPPSPVHNKGETSFIWLSKLAHFPRLNQTVILRDGFFSKYSVQDLHELAQWANKDSSLAAASFEDLIASLTQLPQDFQDKHAWTIMQELVTAAGIAPFKNVPPVSGATQTLTLPVSDLADSILNIFDRELLAGNHWDQDLTHRLNALTEVLLHHIGTDTPISQPAVLKHYFEFLFPGKKSKSQQKQLKTTNDQKKQRFQEAYADIYKPLASVKLDLSVLDCGFGSMIGGFSRSLVQGLGMSPNQLLAMPLGKRLQEVMKNKSALEKRGLTTTALANGETWLHPAEYDIHVENDAAWGPCIALEDGKYDCVLLSKNGSSVPEESTSTKTRRNSQTRYSAPERTVGLSEVFSGADAQLAAA